MTLSEDAVAATKPVPALSKRAISFRAELAALSIEDLSDGDCLSPGSVTSIDHNRRLSHTGSIQVRSPVTPMQARKKSVHWLIAVGATTVLTPACALPW